MSTQRLPIPGSDDDTWGTILNGFLEVSLNGDGTLNSTALASALPAAGAVTSINSVAPNTTTGALTLTAATVGALPTTTKLAGLADTTNASSATNGQVLAYNSTSNLWIPATVSSTTVSNATTGSVGLIQLAGDLGGTATSPTVLTANGGTPIVTTTGTQTISGAKTFSSLITGSVSGNAATVTTNANLTGDVTSSGNATTVAKLQGTTLSTPAGGATSYLNATGGWSTPAGTAANATTSTPGLVQLAGSLGGTATAPTVVTNANLTGPITSTGNATSVAAQVGTGSTFVMSASPTLTGTVTAPNLTATTKTVTPALQVTTGAGTANQVLTSDVSGNATWQAAAGGGAQALVPTAVKTTSQSPYTASPADFVPVDTTSGNVTVTLPSAPADKTRIGVKMVIQGSTNTVIINAGGSDVFNKSGGGTSLTLTLLNQGALLQYESANDEGNGTGIWYVQSDDLALSQLDTRYVQAGGVIAESIQTTTGSTTNWDPTTYAIWQHTLSVSLNPPTFAFSAPISGTHAYSFTLFLIQNGTGGYTVTWPASVKWQAGTAPTLVTSPNTVCILSFTTLNAGTTWYGFLAGEQMQ